jgi:hypothetical protein
LLILTLLFEVDALTMMLNVKVEKTGIILLSLMVTEIGKIPIWSGYEIGAINKWGKFSITKVEAASNFRDTNLTFYP